MLASSHIAASFILEVVGAITDHQVATVGGERATVWVAGASPCVNPFAHSTTFCTACGTGSGGTSTDLAQDGRASVSAVGTIALRTLAHELADGKNS